MSKKINVFKKCPKNAKMSKLFKKPQKRGGEVGGLIKYPCHDFGHFEVDKQDPMLAKNPLFYKIKNTEL